MPRVVLIYAGGGTWVEPTATWTECKHPRSGLTFDGSQPLPSWLYCTACGKMGIHPHHGLTDAEVQSSRERAAEMARDLGFDE